MLAKRSELLGVAVGRRLSCGDGDAMANGDGFLVYQDFFDNEPYDSLALDDIQRFSGTAQAGKKTCQGLSEAEECCLVGGLINDRLQFCTNRALALAQHRHALA